MQISGSPLACRNNGLAPCPSIVGHERLSGRHPAQIVGVRSRVESRTHDRCTRRSRHPVWLRAYHSCAGPVLLRTGAFQFRISGFGCGRLRHRSLALWEVQMPPTRVAIQVLLLPAVLPLDRPCRHDSSSPRKSSTVHRLGATWQRRRAASIAHRRWRALKRVIDVTPPSWEHGADPVPGDLPHCAALGVQVRNSAR